MRGIRWTLAVVLLATIGANPAAAQRLYWVDTNFAAPVMRSIRTDGGDLRSASLTAGTLPEGLALHPTAHQLYWVDSKYLGAQLRRCNLGLAAATSLAGGFSCLRGLDIDPAASRLYWTTSNLVTGPTIQRSDLSGGGVTTLATAGGAANFRGITVDPSHNILFVADFGKHRLLGYDLTGATNPYTIVTGSSTRPYGVALDPGSQILYWTEYESGRLMRKAYATADPPTVILSGLSNPTYLTLDVPGDRIYWVETAPGSHRIRSCHLDGSAVTNITTSVSTYGDIVFASAAALVDIDPLPAVTEFAFGPAVPNPSRDLTTFAYALPRDANVEIVACDVQGRVVSTLLSGRMPAGRHTVAWDKSSTRRLAAGMYYARMRCEGREWVRSVAITR